MQNKTYSISLSPAHIFDLFSILQLKSNKGWDVQYDMKIILDDIYKTIGEEKYISVVNSLEYNALYDSNLLLFDVMEKSAANKVLASEIVRVNLIRYQAKKKLEKVHFESDLLEKKDYETSNTR